MPRKRKLDPDPGRDPGPPTRKRQQLERVDVEYRDSTVKMALGSWMRDGQEDLRATIDDAVDRTTMIAFEGSRFLNLLWMDLEERTQPFPKLDQTFMNRVFSAVAAKFEKPQEDDPSMADPIIAYVKTHIWDPLVDTLPGHKRVSRRGLIQVLNYMSRRFLTASQNHVTTNIRTWIQRYLLWKIRKHAATINVTIGKDLSRKISVHLVNRVLAFHDYNSGIPSAFDLTETLEEQLSHRAMDVCQYAFDKILELLDGRSLNPQWVERNWQEFHPVMSHIRRRNEKHRKELVAMLEGVEGEDRKRFLRTEPRSTRLFKAFNLFPDFSAQAKYIDVDTLGLLQLMAESHDTFKRSWEKKVTRSQYNVKTKEDVLYWWRMMFKIEDVTTQNRMFALRFSTDGTGVSIGVRVPVSNTPPSEPRMPTVLELEGKRVIGVDEGRIDLWVATEGTELVSRGSNKEFYHRAGFIESRLLRQDWKTLNGIQAIESAIPLSRVASKNDYLDYLRYILQHSSKLIDFYCSKKYKRLRFKAYMGRQRAQNEMAEKFVRDVGCDPSQLVVAFGAAKFNINSPGHASSLNGTWLRRALRRRGVWVTPDIDEYMTSQICSKCEQQMPKRTRVWQVKSCPGPCLTCWNRDVNAANNIRSCLLETVLFGQRPEPFRRVAQGG